jgi:methylated-DNA-[protein]-cysteine S-methyltransferase
LPIDLRWVTEFQRKVLAAARRIPFGKCQCYADVARQVGSPNAQRAVGNALGKNPVAIVIPCHRVVASGGSIGGYTGGLDIKQTLMAIEGIDLQEAS